MSRINKSRLQKGRGKSNNGKSEEKSTSNQQSITGYFSKGEPANQLFSTFGSARKSVERKSLKLKKDKPRKQDAKPKDGQDSSSGKERNGKNDSQMTNQTRVLKQCESNDDAKNITYAYKSAKGDVALEPRFKTPFSTKSIVQKITEVINLEDSDDDIIPPTPSPGACHSVLAIRGEQAKSLAIKGFTQIKPSNERTGGNEVKKKPLSPKNDKTKNMTQRKTFQSSSTRKLSFENKTKDLSKVKFGETSTNKLDEQPSKKLNNISEGLLTEQTKKTSVKLCFENNSNNTGINTCSVREDTQEITVLAPAKISKSKITSLKRRASKGGTSPAKKRQNTSSSPSIATKENVKSNLFFGQLDESSMSPTSVSYSIDMDIAQCYGVSMMNQEMGSDKQPGIACNSAEESTETSKPLDLGDISFGDDDFWEGEHGATQLSSSLSSRKKEVDGGSYERKKIVDLALLTPTKLNTTVNDQATPGKEPSHCVQQGFTTPVKSLLETSKDSLMDGIELGGLLDGVEWSPIGKMPGSAAKSIQSKSSPYSPYTTPYSRLLVLEVYRREMVGDTARYGRSLSEKVLRVFEETVSHEKYVYLREDWEGTDVEPGDIVHVTGVFDINSGVCILDNTANNYIIVHPDTLISGTTIAGATRCLRRSILNERFRTEDANEAMLMGTLLHDLFDRAMKSNDFSHDALLCAVQGLLEQFTYLDGFYGLGMTECDALNKVKELLPAFSEWAWRYVCDLPDPDLSTMDYKDGSCDTGGTEMPSVCVSQLRDIEENVWSPRFGLKGKVDATVEVKIDRRPMSRRHRPGMDNHLTTASVPLELKTGKLFSKLGSVEHRAQVILYTLLLSDRYRHGIDTGLLYYMKSGHTIGVPALLHEKRALIMRRNEVARYLTLSRAGGGRTMPAMLQDPHTCKRCSQAQNCSVFHKSLESGDHVTSGMGDLFHELTSHVSPTHCEFFADWFKLVCLEGQVILQSGRSSQHSIWTINAWDREKLGQCFSGMVLDSTVPEHHGKYIHRFERSVDHPSEVSLVDVPITVGERLVVSEEHCNLIAVASGYLRSVTEEAVEITLDRNLAHCCKGTPYEGRSLVFRLDKDEGYSSLTTLWSNVAKLFNKDSERDARLRRMVIDFEPPVFSRSRQALINFSSQSSGSSQSSAGFVLTDTETSQETCSSYQDTTVHTIIQELNAGQKRAVCKALTAEDYALILGMPGTGKTTTIACLVKVLIASGKSVLLTSYTHTAVDNILLKLKEAGVDFLRLGQAHKVLPEIQPYTVGVAGSHVKTVNELRAFYDSKSVVATTCLGVNHALFTQRSFDYCIVDEASQITQPVCLGPLRHARVFVLVGDHYQLPPLVQSLQAREGGMDVSLFKRLSERHPQAVVSLEHQYRMHKDIMTLSNTLIYGDRLKCGTPQVANALLDIPHWDELCVWLRTHASQADDNWLIQALDPCYPVVFLNTDKVPALETHSGSLVSNEREAILVQQLTCALRRGGVEPGSIGIISPYRHQLKLIRQLLNDVPRESLEEIEINTVDKYQGRDKGCILVSLVRSNDAANVGELLKDWRRVNVAVSRAKRKLILIGSLSTLKASLLLRELLDVLVKNKWVKDLPSHAHTVNESLSAGDSKQSQ